VTSGRRLLTAITLVVMAAGGCARAQSTDARTVRHDGATINVAANHTGGRTQVVVTISPDRPDLHLYDIDLDPDTVQGLGIPTAIGLTGGWTATGRPRANRAVRHLSYQPLHVALPVYPNGAVTFTVPAHRGTGPVGVRLSYALCSDSFCLPPVRGLAVALG
jgi:hypothetical protein